MDGTILFGENFKRQPTNGLIYACWSAVYLYFVSMRYSPEPVAVSLFNMRAASKFVMIILAEAVVEGVEGRQTADTPPVHAYKNNQY